MPPPDQQEQLVEPPMGATIPGVIPKDEDNNPGHPRSHSVSAMQPNDSPSHKGDKYMMNAQGNAPIDLQLKYENDRLKLALAQR